MPTAYATKVAEAFSGTILKHTYESAPIDWIVNRDYEGQINAVGSKLNILSFDKLTEKTYTGANLTVDDIYEQNSVLNIDQWKSFYFRIKKIDQWKSFVKNPKGTVLEQKGDERAKNVMTYLLGFWGDVAAGNRIGTDYTTGTVAVATGTGVVTGTGTTFTAAMVGKPFKATGHTTWYRVKTFTSGTSITIEDDSDDNASAYTGGAISAGATYVIQAVTAIAITTANFLQYVAALKARLDLAEVPERDRVLFLPPEAASVYYRATGIVLAVPQVYNDIVKNGEIQNLLGFKVVQTLRLAGDNTNGYHALAIQRSWLTFADKVLETGMEEDLIGNFGAAYKDLYVYGALVADARRKYAAELFATFTA
jgi:hypothetical protein